MSRNRKIILAVVLIAFVLLGLVLLLSGPAGIGSSSTSEIREQWLERGYTFAEAEKLAEKGKIPQDVGESVESELPPSLQGPAETGAIPTAVIGNELGDVLDGNADLQELCQTRECVSALGRLERKNPEVYGSSSFVYYEASERLFVASMVCINSSGTLRPDPPFFSELALSEGSWQMKRFFISKEDFAKEFGSFTQLGEESLEDLRNQLPRSCRGKA